MSALNEPDLKKMLEHDSFRDHLSTVAEDGKRKWVYPTKPKGKWFKKRTAVAIFFYAVFFILPFVYVKGRPVFLFNFPEGKFILVWLCLLATGFFYFRIDHDGGYFIHCHFHQCFWKNFLWMDLPANHLYGNAFSPRGLPRAR